MDSVDTVPGDLDVSKSSGDLDLNDRSDNSAEADCDSVNDAIDVVPGGLDSNKIDGWFVEDSVKVNSVVTACVADVSGGLCVDDCSIDESREIKGDIVTNDVDSVSGATDVDKCSEDDFGEMNADAVTSAVAKVSKDSEVNKDSGDLDVDDWCVNNSWKIASDTGFVKVVGPTVVIDWSLNDSGEVDNGNEADGVAKFSGDSDIDDWSVDLGEVDADAVNSGADKVSGDFEGNKDSRDLDVDDWSVHNFGEIGSGTVTDGFVRFLGDSAVDSWYVDDSGEIKGNSVTSGVNKPSEGSEVGKVSGNSGSVDCSVDDSDEVDGDALDNISGAAVVDDWSVVNSLEVYRDAVMDSVAKVPESLNVDNISADSDVDGWPVDDSGEENCDAVSTCVADFSGDSDVVWSVKKSNKVDVSGEVDGDTVNDAVNKVFEATVVNDWSLDKPGEVGTFSGGSDIDEWSVDEPGKVNGNPEIVFVDVSCE